MPGYVTLWVANWSRLSSTSGTSQVDDRAIVRRVVPASDLLEIRFNGCVSSCYGLKISTRYMKNTTR